ncbi:MAG: SOS response-associated peptidase family protein [Proteobacteria bacterium]|nr:SOS response-associated peptidase family protein [Pseudomonadota bacterium]
MCYSALVQEDWRAYRRHLGVEISLPEFAALVERRRQEPARYRLPRAFDLELRDEPAIRDSVDRYRQQQTAKLEGEAFTQRKRLADAERKLAVKETRTAAESRRIASGKVQQALDRLSLLKDDRRHADDYRIFPRSWAPIILVRDGRKVLQPARYLLRQPGAQSFMDERLSGNYNARRDNLTKFWRGQFGATHAVMVIQSFFENVTGRDGKNQVLHFNPAPAGPMLIACLYSDWSDPGTGEQLLSFAAITDEPPPEVAAAGHDRMIVNLKPQNVDAWLTPQGRSVAELQAILDDRQTPYYEHRIAA